RAEVTDPLFEVETKTYLDIIDRYAKNRTQVLKELSFAKDLFKENPECLEFDEFLSQSETALDNYEFDKAMAIINGAVQACRDAISSTGDEEYDEAQEVESLAPEQKAANLVIFAIEIVALIILMISLFYYYNKKHKVSSIHVGTYQLGREFDSLLDKLRFDLGELNIGSSKSKYQQLLNIYTKINKTSIPFSQKKAYYEKIRLAQAEITELIRGGSR
ncbi:MAG: hypothetical protein ABIC04_04690, partial [Nanoarchaeota archaeon]